MKFCLSHVNAVVSILFFYQVMVQGLPQSPPTEENYICGLAAPPFCMSTRSTNIDPAQTVWFLQVPLDIDVVDRLSSMITVK
ncbi:hypothetical protein BDP27DRAFT_1421622 [Rhodocollybia butyracea]|uniref:Uncharacterized protein n=1 Tax=Rhodocollybia butyracea TaxID=206335 RepID=A0A9P5U6F2_9AGAR|nr:hypothetical protein BDP27DRAFT_1421622 [Rhodocollybia butyracea]